MSNLPQNTLSPLQVGDAVRAKALSYAAKTGPAIDLVVVKAADAKHEFSLGPINLYRAIKANLTEEEIDGLPQPGSHWNQPAGIGNNNPDICQWKDPSKPDAKAKEISFYVVWADGTPEGAHVVKELEWLSRIAQENMKTDDIDAAWLAKYATFPQAAKKRRKYLEGRRATVRKAYKDTVRLLWQLDCVNELVIYDFARDQEGNVIMKDGKPTYTDKVVGGCIAELDEDTSGENTVMVSNLANPKREYKLYGVGAFLKLDPRKALENGGTFAALEATASRDKPPVNAPKTGELKLNAIATPDTSDKVAMVWLSYLDKAMSDKSGQEYTALLKHLTGAGGGQAVLTLGHIRKRLNELFRMDTIQSIYDTQDTATTAATKAI